MPRLRAGHLCKKGLFEISDDVRFISVAVNGRNSIFIPREE